MNELSEDPTLKDINAYKRKLTWGEVPSVYQMAYSSVSELDGILTHGFDSSYKQMFNKELWNLKFLGSYKDGNGDIRIANKPKIILRHVYNEQNYELHCYPVVQGNICNVPLIGHAKCPFVNWYPESMQLLFRLNSLVSFIVYSFQGGDQADIALIRYSHLQVTELIDKLQGSFDIVNIKGYSIADFFKEIYRRQPNFHLSDILDTPNE